MADVLGIEHAPGLQNKQQLDKLESRYVDITEPVRDSTDCTWWTLLAVKYFSMFSFTLDQSFTFFSSVL